MLKIEVLPDKIVYWKGFGVATGKITIGDFSESFNMCLDTWSLDDYKQQWVEAIERLKTHDTSCFINTFSDKERHLYYQIYHLYRFGNEIFVTWQYPPWKWVKKFSKNKPKFTIKTCYEYITPYESHSEDTGNPITTWKIEDIYK